MSIIDQNALSLYETYLERILPAHILHYVIDDLLFKNEKNYDENFKFLCKRLLNARPIVKLDRYLNYEHNKHHWTTSFVWNNIIPSILSAFGMKFDENLYEFISNFFNGFDLSYHVRKESYLFMFKNFSANCLRSGDQRTLRCFVPHMSKYHDLFAGGHCVSLLLNLTIKSGKKLIVNCDSMSIPIVPILANYFDSILCLDNRTANSYHDLIWQFKPTHYIGLALYRSYASYEQMKTNSNKLFIKNLT